MNIIFHFLAIICIWKAENKIILPFEILAKSTQGKKIMLEKFFGVRYLAPPYFYSLLKSF